MRNPFARWSAKRFVVVGVLLAVGIVGLSLGLILPKTPSKTPAAVSSTTSSSTTTTVPVTTTLAPPTTEPLLPKDRCPLTDLPAPGGVPKRPALAVKVGNEPDGARPQSGLNEADIVFDTPAEGFIMRYIAVYQCNNAASIGPTRSVRWVDWHVVRMLINPILAFAGGINPNVDQVESFGWLGAANLLESAAGAGVRITSRVAPDNLYTSTDALYGLFPKRDKQPAPIFAFSARVPGGAVPTSSLSIDFSYGTDVVWKWDPSRDAWLHTYSGSPDIDTLTGQPVTATNIVVLRVRYKFGPYIESTGGSGDFESQTLGRGVGYILRNGTSTKVTWSRRYLIDPFSFTRAHGEVVKLESGRTWVELVPVSTTMQLGS